MSSSPKLDSTLTKPKFSYDGEKRTLDGVPIWKLFIDKKSHPYGEMAFDKPSPFSNSSTGEPGYKAAMDSAFAYMLHNVNKKLDVEEFKLLHGLCISSVDNLTIDPTVKDPIADRWTIKSGMYGFVHKEATEAAKAEWESEKLIYTGSEFLGPEAKEYVAVFSEEGFGPISDPLVVSRAYYAFFSNNYYKAIDIAMRDSRKFATERINAAFSDYYKDIEKAQSKDEKLAIIVSLCRKLEIGHSFIDGNQRTIVFDGYLSKSELVEQVKQGMQYFLELSKNPELSSSQNLANRYTQLREQNTPSTETESEESSEVSDDSDDEEVPCKPKCLIS